MKKSVKRIYYFAAGVCCVLLLFVFAPKAQAAPMSNVPVTIRQPDGSKVSFLASGDEYFHYYHNASGFIITRDEDGWYVYAKPENGKPVPTPYVVGQAGSWTKARNTAMTFEDIDFEKNPDLIHDELEVEREPFLQGGGASTYSFAEDQGPTDQHMANLVVFIRFPGEEEFVQTRNGHPVITFSDGKEVDLQERYDQVSEYMQKISHGKFNVETTFLTADPGSGEITSAVAPRSRSSYEGNMSDIARRDLEMEMLDYALEQTKESAPDGFQLDYNEDHYVDNVTFIVSGEVGDWNSLLWPHSWVFQKYSCGIDTGDGPKWVSQFNFNFGHPRYAGLGVLSHELLHAVGYPDLYRYSYDGYPVGEWDAMATTDYADPQFLGGYLKAAYAGWGNVEEVMESGTYTLKPIGTDDDSVEAYLIPTEETYEYIAIECRKPDKSGVPNPSTDNVPTEGLVVYRVNQLAPNGNRNGNPGQNEDEVYVFREGDLGVNAGTTGPNDSYLKAAALQTGESFGTPDMDVRPDGTTNPIYLGNGKNTGIVIDNVVIDEETGEATFRISLPAGDPGITPDGAATYNVDAKDYLINQSGDYHFAGSTQTHHILVTNGNEVNIYLDNVTMNLSGVDKAAPILVRNGVKVNLYLSGESHLNGGEFAAAVAVSPNAELCIYSQTPQTKGKIIAVGGDGCAGIGCNAVSPSGKITAEGVEITARGGNGYTIVSGGTTVFSTYGAAGIGSREDEAGGEIVLKDCVLNLTGGVPNDIGGTTQYALSNGWKNENRDIFGHSDISILNCQITTAGGILAGRDVLLQNSALTCEAGFIGARRYVTVDKGSANIFGDDWGILVGAQEGKAAVKGGAKLEISNVRYNAARGKAPGFFQVEAGTHVTMLSPGKYPVSYDGISDVESAKLAFGEPFGIRTIFCWLGEQLKGDTVFRLQRDGVVCDSIHIPAGNRSFFITIPEDGAYSFRDNNEACTQELTVFGEGVHGWEQLTFHASDEKAKKWDISTGSLHITEGDTAYTVYGSSSTNTVTVDPDLQNIHIYLQGVTYRSASPFLTLGENAQVNVTVGANTENILENSGGPAVFGKTGSFIRFNGTGKLSAAGKGAPAIQGEQVRVDRFVELAAYSDTEDAVVQSGSVWTPDMGMEPILAFLEFNKPLTPGLRFHLQSDSTSSVFQAPQSAGASHGVFTLAAQGNYTMRTEENEYASIPCPHMVNRVNVSLHGEQGVEESIDLSTPTRQYSLRENGTYTVTGECTSGEARCITVESGVNATVILDGVKYTRDEQKTQLPFLSLQGSASVTLVLRNTNEIIYDANSSPFPAIAVPGGAVLTIQEDGEHPGVLNMTGPISAPEKPSFRKSCGTLVLRSGTLNLKQHFGYVFGGTNAKIRILGGRICTDAAEGSSNGCGVGGVNSDIQISGGELELNHGYEKNGILGGENSCVAITGGSVTINIPDDVATCVGGDYSVVMVDGGNLNIVDPFRSYVAISLPLAVGGDGSSTTLNSGHVYVHLLRGGSAKGMLGGRSAEVAFGKNLDLTIVNYWNELDSGELFNKYCAFTSECGTFLGELDVTAKEEMNVCVSQNGAPLRENLTLPPHTGSFLFTVPMGEEEFLPFDLTLDTPDGDYGGGWSLSRNTVKNGKAIEFGRPRIRLDDASFPYDGNPHSLAVSGDANGASVTYSGNKQTEPGKYTVTATVTPAGKSAYTLTATMTILKTPLPILSVTAQDKEYDGTDNATLAIETQGETLPDDAFTYTARFDSAAIGENKPVTIAGVKLSGKWALRYELTGEVPKTSTASIEKKTLDITFEEDAGLMQSASQTVRPVTPTFHGLVKGESLSEYDYTVAYQPTSGGAASTSVPTALGSYNVSVTVNAEHYRGNGSATLEIVNGHDIGASSLTINAPGIYLVHGSTTDNHIEVNCDGVTLLFCDVQIDPASGPAVKVNASDLTIVAESGTENRLSASSGAAVECTQATALTLGGSGYCTVSGHGSAPALSGPSGSTCALENNDLSSFVFSAEGSTAVQGFTGLPRGEERTSMVSMGFNGTSTSDTEYIVESFGGKTQAVLPAGCQTLALCLPRPTWKLSSGSVFNSIAFLTLRESTTERVLRVSRYFDPTLSLTGLPLAASEKTGSFNLKQGPVSITESGRYTITGDPSTELSNKITVNDGLAVELVLQDVRIKGTVSDSFSGLIQCGEDTALKVEFLGNCTLTSTGGGLCLYAGEGALVELDGSGTLQAKSAGTAIESRGRLTVYGGTYNIAADNGSGNAQGIRAYELLLKDGVFDISCSTSSQENYSAAICALGRQFDEKNGAGYQDKYYLPSLTIKGGQYRLSLTHGTGLTDYNGVLYAYDKSNLRGSVTIEDGSFQVFSEASGTPFLRSCDAVITGGDFQLELPGQPSYGIWSDTLQMGEDVSFQAWFGVEKRNDGTKDIHSLSLKANKLLPLNGYTPCVLEFYLNGRFFDNPGKISMISVDDYPDQPVLADVPKTGQYTGFASIIPGTGSYLGSVTPQNDGNSTIPVYFASFEEEVTTSGVTRLVVPYVESGNIKRMDVSLRDESFQYDGTTKSLRLRGNIPKNAVVTFGGNSGVKPGDYKVSVSVHALGYADVNTSATMTIEPAHLGALVNADDKAVYDGTTETTGTISLDGVVPGDQVEIADGAVFTFADANVGQNKAVTVTNVALTGKDADKYVLDDELHTTASIVDPAPVKLNIMQSSLIQRYDGKAKQAQISAVAETIQDPSDPTKFLDLPCQVLYNGKPYDEAGAYPSELGSYTVAITVNEPNFQPISQTETMHIIPPEITGVSLEDSTVVYNGQEQGAVVTGALPTDQVVYAYGPESAKPGEFVSQPPVNVGTYQVIATVTRESHQTLELSAKLVIKPKEIALQGIQVPAVKQTASLTFPVQNSSDYDREASGILSRDQVTVSYTAAYRDNTPGENKSVDLTNIVLGGLGAGNYALSSTTAQGTGSVLEAAQPTPTPPTPSVPDADPPMPAWENPFTDVAENAWYYNAVQYTVENGLFHGTSNTTFSPNSPMTRGMLATILYRLEKEPEVTAESLFDDVENGRYYTEAIAWAVENGYVTGYGNNRFGPNDPITREQLAAILWRCAGKPESAGTLDAFTDSGKAGKFALPALRWAVEQEIIHGKSDVILAPTGNASRAEVAAMLMRYCEKME